MKIEEAIGYLKRRQHWLSDDEDTAVIERRYKATEQCRYGINCLDMAISALEKQMSKPPEHKVHEKYPSLGKDYYCQECGVMFMDWEAMQTNYCGNCGQKLK